MTWAHVYMHIHTYKYTYVDHNNAVSYTAKCHPGKAMRSLIIKSRTYTNYKIENSVILFTMSLSPQALQYESY
jgi:hypothetical protein